MKTSSFDIHMIYLSLFIPYTVYPLLSYKRLCTDKNIDLISVSHNSVTAGTS